MKTYLVRSATGAELGRLLARTGEEAMKTARECWPGRAAKATELKLRGGAWVEDEEEVDQFS